jgi:hypothetical protein
MAEHKFPIEPPQKQLLSWGLSILVAVALVALLWWIAVEFIVVIVNAFEVIAWVVGFILWPFRL